MLALDPPLGEGDAATIGGVIASGDSGPLRHRYGAPRDLVLGMTVALSDGTVAKAGSKVIKNVAGYDLAKLFSGSFGTLGLILQVAVRLHPQPHGTVTAVGRSNDPEAVARGASELAHVSLEKECVDVRWETGEGAAMARLGGATAGPQAEAARRVLADAGLEAELVEDDFELWDRQRAAQRSTERAVVRVSGRQAELTRTIQAADALGGRLVGRASLGISWIALDPQHVADLRRAARAVQVRAARRTPRRADVARRLGCGAVSARRARQAALRPRRGVRAGHLRRRDLRTWPASTPIRPPEKELIEDCVHCGFCLPTCPTYHLWGEEMDSPRGRIVLMSEAEQGAEVSGQMVTHWDRCLGCMACVTACPSGVQYDKLIEDTRAQVERNHSRSPGDRLFRSLLFELFPHPGRLRALAPLMALGAPARHPEAGAPGRSLPAAARGDLAYAVHAAARHHEAPAGAAPGARGEARHGRPAPGLRAARVLPRRERGHGERARRRGLRGARAAPAALLRRAADAHRLRLHATSPRPRSRRSSRATSW